MCVGGVSHREEEVRQGFRDIMEAYKEEVTFLFYQEGTGVRDQVFNYFYSEYKTEVEQKLGTFQGKYGKIIERQDTVLKEVRVGFDSVCMVCVCEREKERGERGKWRGGKSVSVSVHVGNVHKRGMNKE